MATCAVSVDDSCAMALLELAALTEHERLATPCIEDSRKSQSMLSPNTDGKVAPYVMAVAEVPYVPVDSEEDLGDGGIAQTCEDAALYDVVQWMPVPRPHILHGTQRTTLPTMTSGGDLGTPAHSTSDRLTPDLKPFRAEKRKRKTCFVVLRCELCTYSTTSRSNMDRHYRAHVNDRPYVCPICPYKSSRSDDLRKHMLRHDMDGKSRRQCRHGCMYATNDVSNLTRHERRCNGQKRSTEKKRAVAVEGDGQRALVMQVQGVCPAAYTTAHDDGSAQTNVGMCE
jgi:hypothetical protein